MPNEDAPAVSVLFPVFNEDLNFLRMALRSLQDQSFTHFEVLILDDSDNTDVIRHLIEHCQHDPRFRHLRGEVRLGLVRSLNRGIEEARGKFIARADSDDIQHPDRFSVQVAHLEKNSHLGVLGTAIVRIDADGREHGIREYPQTQAAIFKAACITNPVAHPTVMMRRGIFETHGPYDETFKRAEDYELWLRLLSRGVIFENIAQPLLHYRISSAIKRDDLNWKFNLKAKTRHFKANHLLRRLAGILAVRLFLMLPATWKTAAYGLYARKAR